MGTPLTVTCPQCQQPIKASNELVGKKVRCKGCAHVFVIAAGPAEKPRPPKPAAAPATAKAPAAAVDDEGPDEYAFADHKDAVPRCPHCANEIEADAKICLHCGYNTVSRQRVETKKTFETTAGDRLAWLFPGLLSAFAILVLLGLALIYCLLLPDWLQGGSWDWLSYNGFKLWFVIMCLFGMYYAGKFAVKRLILNPTPPEKTRGG
jgi:DNA-directed RNA polymerase subunit RPC12/RpoP